jgi:catechol 2,3-dioxygenase-like lactoylglutathione lyase family enzyme
MAQAIDQDDRPRLVGVNHVALEVGDLDAALAFYDAIFAFTLRGRSDDHAFIDLGDQFLALAETQAAAARGPDYKPDAHFGLVVSNRARAKALVVAAGGELVRGTFLDFYDPWRNRIEVVDYADVQFSKTPAVLRGMDLHVSKSPNAVSELRRKGLSSD